MAAEVSEWEEVDGYIPATDNDIHTGHLTLDEAKLHCDQLSGCVAITYRATPDAAGRVWAYLKGGKTVHGSDKRWKSLIKQPAGLMRIRIHNPFEFAVEVCWVDSSARVPPICYGTASAHSRLNLSSYEGHHFVSKRLVWTATASGGGGGGETHNLDVREAIMAAHGWDHREWM